MALLGLALATAIPSQAGATGPSAVPTAVHDALAMGNAGRVLATANRAVLLPSPVRSENNRRPTLTSSSRVARTARGVHRFALLVPELFGPGTQSLPLSSGQPPTITSTAHTTFVVGKRGSFTVTATGVPAGPAITISDGGTKLPHGVSFVDDHNGTATISGTPGADTGGAYPFTIRAVNGVYPDTAQVFTLGIDQSPEITSADHTTFAVGKTGTFIVTTTGVPTGPTLAISLGGGTLPTGVGLIDNGDGTDTITGAPVPCTGGTYRFTITASNGTSPDASQAFVLTVVQQPAITSMASTTFTVGTTGRFTVSATGVPFAPRLMISDPGARLPRGVSFVAWRNATATLAGTPAPGSAGSYRFTLRAANEVTPVTTQRFTLFVNSPPVIASAGAATFTVGTAGRFRITTRGFPSGPAFAIFDGGAKLPEGLSFVANHNATASISGRPAIGTAGTYPLTLTASNGVFPPASQAFTIIVENLPGYVLTTSTGQVSTFGDVKFHGSVPRKALFARVVGVAVTPGGDGYWVVDAEGGVFSFGNARFLGSLPGRRANVSDVVGMASTARGDGYWLVAANGAVFCFGKAQLFGSLRGAGVDDIVAIAATGDAKGYYLAGSDGRVYSFGDAHYQGGANSSVLKARVVSITVNWLTGGYWLAGASGSVFSFDTATFPIPAISGGIVGLATSCSGNGYYLARGDGEVFSGGDANVYRRGAISQIVAISSP